MPLLHCNSNLSPQQTELTAKATQVPAAHKLFFHITFPSLDCSHWVWNERYVSSWDRKMQHVIEELHKPNHALTKEQWGEKTPNGSLTVLVFESKALINQLSNFFVVWLNTQASLSPSNETDHVVSRKRWLMFCTIRQNYSKWGYLSIFFKELCSSCEMRDGIFTMWAPCGSREKQHNEFTSEGYATTGQFRHSVQYCMAGSKPLGACSPTPT